MMMGNDATPALPAINAFFLSLSLARQKRNQHRLCRTGGGANAASRAYRPFRLVLVRQTPATAWLPVWQKI